MFENKRQITYFQKKMCTNSLMILRVWKSSYKLSSRGMQSNYFVQDIVKIHPCIHPYIHASIHPYIHASIYRTWALEKV